MPKRLISYISSTEALAYRNRERKKNYSRSQKHIGKRKGFTEEEDNAILRHSIPDRDLSNLIDHSVESIQIRRSRLKKN